MRRAAALSLLAPCVLVCAALAAPAEPCVWRDDPTAPAFTTAGRMAIYRRTFACPGAASGAWRLRFEAVVGGARKTIDSKKGTVEARGRWWRETALHDPLAPSQFCPEPPPAGAPRALAPDHDGIHTEPTVGVDLVATFEGEGALAGLARTERVTVRCDACPAPRGGAGLGVYEGRAMAATVRPGVRLRGRAERAFFECARDAATLEVRWFTGDDTEGLRRALRPAYVQTGLEKGWRVEGDAAVFDVPVPVDRLCRHPGRRVAWEVSGEGLLPRLGGGGRSEHELKCR